MLQQFNFYFFLFFEVELVHRYGDFESLVAAGGVPGGVKEDLVEEEELLVLGYDLVGPGEEVGHFLGKVERVFIEGLRLDRI